MILLPIDNLQRKILNESTRKIFEYFNIENPTTTGSGAITDDYGNSYDYTTITVSVGPYSISVSKDNFGQIYDGSGFNAGKAAGVVSVSVTFGQVVGGLNNKKEASDFLAGSSFNASVGGFLGVTRTDANNRTAYETGLYTPQAGVGGMFSRLRP